MIVSLKAFLVAALLSFCLTPLVRILAIKIKAVDLPDKRKVHVEPIPRLGGLAIYCAFILTMLIFLPLGKEMQVLLTGCTFIVFIGILDDLYNMQARFKLLGQIVAACIPLFFGLEIDVLTDPWGGMLFLPAYIAYPLSIIWVVGAVNTVNLIDGLDGLAAGITCIAAVTLAVVALKAGVIVSAVLMAILAGSTFGFLRYNFNPASIFMGDTGSMLLGYVIAVVSMVGAVKSIAAIAFLVPIFAIGVPVLDTFFAILRRGLARQPIFKPDKGHLHHRLLAIGFSHKSTVLIMYLISVCLCVCAVFLVQLPIGVSSTLVLLLFLLACFLARRIGVLKTK